jgi:ATP-dependent Lhr-like helicase
MSGTLFEDAGIISFGPEGEAEYGRKNFLEILSVFTSPPLFRVISGQKELGNVHESRLSTQADSPAR